MPADELLTINDVVREFRISRSTLWRWRVKGEFPECIQLSENCIRVKRSTIERFLLERMA